ncbi:bifunctional diguanylate cyclase/phosphodiesterase [Actinoplanes sp. DH11]|uniref:putative bifunctional diguanylate cyclase/phosphodiesterase n=1 Tax=Actinoplanes sp. DH11 TaxID=2857011 RepID=UPI001E41EBC3|nr:GGDEF domain-containing phosphodiesterase [Actinoplanes sp. DH11]
MIADGVPTLAGLAVPVAACRPGTPISAVESLLRADPAAAGVVVVDGDTVHLIDRPTLDAALTGRLGFGRALLHGRPLSAVLGAPALVLPATTTWDDAARAALARPVGSKAIPLVVRLGAQDWGMAPIGPLVDYLSGLHARLAVTDDLTGLGNRRLLTELLAQGRPETQALLFVDLNRFKDINDTLGHASGDILLQKVAGALRAAAAPGTGLRLGGDEFVVHIADVTGLPGTGTVEHRLRDAGHRLLHAIAGPFPVGGVPITVEAALGIAHGGMPGLTDLSAAADAAMYAAKRDRTRVELWSRALTSTHTADLAARSELRTAVGAGQLTLHYQPLVCARTHRIVSVEALVRWAHPTRGLLAPGLFLPQAEQSEIIHALTERVLHDAVEQAARWHHAGRDLPVAVNLAAPVLTDDRIALLIEGLLAQHRLPAGALIVEITESAVMTRPEQSAELLRAIRAMGVRIAMDDFGTGYTSLALLSRLPLDELKLDRAFVMRIHHQQERVIVEAVSRMANGLGLTLVAEGVEDEPTARILTDLGADLLQGYHFARPAPAADLPASLSPLLSPA